MPVIHFPNLRFEDELSGAVRSVPSSLAQLTAELAVLTGLRAESGDVVLVESPWIPEGLPDCLSQVRFLTLPQVSGLLSSEGERAAVWRLEPWGWSDSARGLLRQLRLQQPVPAIDAVQRVNTREFAAEYDVLVHPDTGAVGAPFGRLCETLEQVRAVIGEYGGIGAGSNVGAGADRWVIKANLSHAARNRLLGSGSELSDGQQGWLSRRFQDGHPVYVEPWVRRLRECGLQWTIVESAGGVEVRFDGAAEMLTDALGQYRGSLIGEEQCGRARGVGLVGARVVPWWEAAVEHGRRAVLAAAKTGFRGAMGIDCMLVERGGERWLRAAHDMNGRQTMGRLALSLERLLPEGFCGAWCHIPSKSGLIAAESSCEPALWGVSAVRTNPLQLAGRQPLLQTRLLIGETVAEVTAAARQLTQAAVPV